MRARALTRSGTLASVRGVGADPPSAKVDESAEIAAAAAGDREAFGRLYDRYARLVHGVLLARVGPTEADDLVQEVFITAMEKLHTLRNPDAIGGWLAMIARNRAMDHIRRAPPLRELPPELATRDPARAEAEEVLEAIQSLPEAYRDTLILRLVEGMTGPEIAARTGMKPASVRVNLHRGMKRLRALLATDEADHER